MENEETKKESKKLSYEELNNVANQLSQQNKALYEKYREVQMGNAFKRLDYLFKVLEYTDKNVFPEDFIQKCVDEIIEFMTIPDKPKKEHKNASN